MEAGHRCYTRQIRLAAKEAASGELLILDNSKADRPNCMDQEELEAGL